MDFRKIIGFGKGGFVVSLPREWIVKNKLKKGDILSMDELTHSLNFSIKHDAEAKKDSSITIVTEDKSLETIKTEIITAYLNCYNIIEILGQKKLENSKKIKEILRNLAGIEIMEQTTRRIVAKDLININDISIDNIIRRMDNIIRGMMLDVIDSIKGEDCSESLLQRDDDVNRLFYLVKRVIKNAFIDPHVAKILKKDILRLVADRLAVRRLEKIADRQKRIARCLKYLKMDEKKLKMFEKIYSELREAYLEIMKGYYTDNKNIALKIEVSNESRFNSYMMFLKDNTGCNFKRSKSKDNCEEHICVTASKVVENLVGTNASIRYLARIILES